jgi:hypothetical protein
MRRSVRASSCAFSRSTWRTTFSTLTSASAAARIAGIDPVAAALALSRAARSAALSTLELRLASRRSACEMVLLTVLMACARATTWGRGG